MRKIIAFLLAAILLLTGVVSALAEGISFTPGTYEGSARGMNGTLNVTVTVSENKIESIQVGDNGETVGYGDVAIDMIPQRIVDQQSLKVDTVAGATITSYAVMNAVESALKQASSDLSALKVAAPKAELVQGEDATVDVVIVGAGLAGINAAYELKNNYPDVSYLILEQLDVITGSLPPSGGALLATNSYLHTEYDAVSTIDDIIEELEKATGHEINRSYAEKIYSNSEELMDRLLDYGAEFPVHQLSSAARNDKVTAFIAEDNGEGFASFYYNLVKNHPINLRMHSKVTELIVDEGTVVGVKVQDAEKEYSVHAKAVLLATGGFGANKTLMEKYAPDFAPFFSRTSAGADGSGFTLTEQFNPEVIGTGVMGPNLAAALSLERFQYPFYVSKEGKRFANEKVNVDVLKAMREDGITPYVIVDGKYETPASNWPWVESVQTHLDLGYAKKFDTLEELADAMGINKENLLATVAEYNAAIDAGETLEFGLNPAQATKIDTPPYYVERLIGFYFGTIPSLKVDEEMHLLDGDGAIVPGLYCAGELTEANLWDNNYPGAGVGISYATYSGAYAIRTMMKDLNP